MLARALAGLDSQRFRDFEVIVVNDGSGDGTEEWLQSSRRDIRVVTARSRGAAAARNCGVEQARGELVAFLDDDDLWLPSYLEAQVANLAATPAGTLSYADHFEVDRAGRRSRPVTTTLLPSAGPLVRLLAESYIHTMSVVVARRTAFERFGAFDESLAIVHDLEWYARVLGGGGSILPLERPLVYRSVPGGLVTSHRDWYREERIVVDGVLARNEIPVDAVEIVRAYRWLLFARIALAKGDVAFGAARLAEALLRAPSSSVRIAALRLGRGLRNDRAARNEEWDRHAEAVS
jgi:glycosyltransferase involved in cell wall biosynthesis